MSKRAYYLMLVVLIGSLISQVLARNEFIETIDQPMLLDSHVLDGIEKFVVQITSVKDSFDKESPPWNKLPDKVKQKFYEANIDIVLRPISNEQPNASILPVLQIYINSLELKETEQTVFHIQTVFKTKVCLDEKPLRHIKADVWKTKPVMKAVSLHQLPTRITDEVLEQVQAFIFAYNAANSKHAESENKNILNTQRPAELSPRQAASDALTQPIHSRFIASKNSKVFHNSECQWVQKIKSENLVIYNSREQVINAGKRPCKICNP
ncbi:MAG: hypothetical protein ACYSR3_05010 [Planctomycetota bacterium]|jgi:hypothetical protein